MLLILNREFPREYEHVLNAQGLELRDVPSHVSNRINEDEICNFGMEFY